MTMKLPSPDAFAPACSTRGVTSVPVWCIARSPHASPWNISGPRRDSFTKNEAPLAAQRRGA